MNTNINTTNNLNFGATLNISKVKGSKQRWNNIAKIFAENTKNNNDIVELSGSFKKGLKASFNPKERLYIDTLIKPASSKILKEQNDSTIAEVFYTLLNAYTKNSTIK